MLITGQGHVTILDIRFKCNYAPEIHKSVVSMGVLTKQGIISSFYPDGRLELSIGNKDY